MSDNLWAVPDKPVAVCDRCGRKTWGEAIGDEDRLTQPDGNPCGGRFGVADGDSEPDREHGEHCPKRFDRDGQCDCDNGIGGAGIERPTGGAAVSERCDESDPRTGKRCALIDGHTSNHRWWRVRSQDRPMWKSGLRRIEWETDRPSRRLAPGDSDPEVQP